MSELTVVVGVAQRPGFVRVKVCISSNASAREIGVCEETPLAVEGRAVTVETGGKKDHDVRFFALAFQLRVRDLLDGKRKVNERSDYDSL